MLKRCLLGYLSFLVASSCDNGKRTDHDATASAATTATTARTTLMSNAVHGVKAVLVHGDRRGSHNNGGGHATNGFFATTATTTERDDEDEEDQEEKQHPQPQTMMIRDHHHQQQHHHAHNEDLNDVEQMTTPPKRSLYSKWSADSFRLHQQKDDAGRGDSSATAAGSSSEDDETDIGDSSGGARGSSTRSTGGDAHAKDGGRENNKNNSNNGQEANCVELELLMTREAVSAGLKNGFDTYEDIRFGTIQGGTIAFIDPSSGEGTDPPVWGNYTVLTTFLSPYDPETQKVDCIGQGLYQFAPGEAVTFTTACTNTPYMTITGGQGSRFMGAYGSIQYMIPHPQGYIHRLHVCTPPTSASSSSTPSTGSFSASS